MKRVLFICTGNSARSQMAEGILRKHGGGRFIAQSAGTVPQTEVNRFAIEVLREKGIDTTRLYPKAIDKLAHQEFDIVITVCDKAREMCPIYPDTTRVYHWPIEDPAKYTGSYAEILYKFREIRDEIEKRIESQLLDKEL